MKIKKIVFCTIVAAMFGLYGVVLHSNYAHALEDADSENREAQKNAPTAKTDPGDIPEDWTEEVLMEFHADGNELTIRVGSGGCTQKQDFYILCRHDRAASQGEAPHYALTIYRTRLDTCKAIIWDGVEITFQLQQDLGLPEIFTYSVTNKVGVSPNT